MKRLFTAALIALPAWAHAGEPLAPHDLWTGWEFDPGVVIPLAVTAWLFLRAPRVPAVRRAFFWSGWGFLAVALVSPLHRLGEALFSAHMAQHEILMAVAAPLLVLGQPLAPLLRGIPQRPRRALVRAARAPWFRRVWAAATEPFSAWAIHAAAICVWHIPALFQATLASDLVHTAQHISFFGSALLFWWALLEGRSYGAAVLYVFATATYTGLLGAFLAVATRNYYPAYTGTAPAWGFTPLEDQQLGGLIMWVPAGIIYTAAGVWLFAAWLRHSEARLRRAALLGCAVAAVFLMPACGRDRNAIWHEAATLTGGDPARGRDAIAWYGCGSCHTIYGVPNANGLVGPPLTGIARRMYIAGVLENTPDNMERWIRNPREVDPKTAMPYLGVKPSDARNIVGYLYTLR